MALCCSRNLTEKNAERLLCALAFSLRQLNQFELWSPSTTQTLNKSVDECNIIAGIKEEGGRGDLSLSALLNNFGKHNFLFTFPSPEVLNNALKVYGGGRQKKWNHILYMLCVCVCVCVWRNCPFDHWLTKTVFACYSKYEKDWETCEGFRLNILLGNLTTYLILFRCWAH